MNMETSMKKPYRNRQTLWKKFRSLNKLIKMLLRILKK
ncbi:hypothetical protein HPHPP74_0119 [Helicobacter pylori Hp P-74]|nr:hypothetical protein HPHPP74_0119 [Helicobacter pylori Hp P-74]EJC49843.1 hypothetical protein HPHPP41_1648 [Helicobacter pylori Hp P-41]